MAKLKAPADGVTVRMFRQGHGDCFLLAFPSDGGGAPYYVLIDCGMKPGSQAFLKHKKALRKIVTEHLFAACGGHLDLVILTHEHQDHLNGIWRRTIRRSRRSRSTRRGSPGPKIPTTTLANQLRTRHKDQFWAC